MNIYICVGSSCHVKGSSIIVEMFKKEIAEQHLEEKINLMGSFCMGKCNREGVSIRVDDDIYTMITEENFKTFFEEKVLAKLRGDNNV